MCEEASRVLNGIVGLSDVVLGTALTEEQREHLSAIQEASEVVGARLAAAVEYRRLRAGAYRPIVGRYSVEAVLASTGSVLEGWAQEKGLGFELAGGASLPEMVETDGWCLRHCLVSVGRVAVSGGEGGRLVLSAALEEEWGGLRLRFDVRRGGWEPSLADQRELFSPNYWGGSIAGTLSGDLGGSLALAGAWAKSLGGRLGVAVAEGEGVCFTLSMPVTVEGGAREGMDGGDKAVVGDSGSGRGSDEVLVISGWPARRRRISLRGGVAAERLQRARAEVEGGKAGMEDEAGECLGVGNGLPVRRVKQGAESEGAKQQL